MIYIWLNAVPILLATLAGLVFGLLWHRALGKGRLRPGVVLVALVAQAWFAAILAGALILAPPQAPPWVMAIGSAVVIWAGFVLPAVLVALVYHGQRFGRALGHAFYWLGLMLVQAVMLKAIGLVPPPA
jgi:hypothetical protein